MTAWESMRQAVMNQLGDFAKAEQGNRVAPYNMAGLMNAMGAVMDQFKPAGVEGGNGDGSKK